MKTKSPATLRAVIFPDGSSADVYSGRLRLCEDCQKMVTERRLRCRNCQKLICGWCWNHVHHRERLAVRFSRFPQSRLAIAAALKEKRK